jgi:hypothetical protein
MGESPACNPTITPGITKEVRRVSLPRRLGWRYAHKTLVGIAGWIGWQIIIAHYERS